MMGDITLISLHRLTSLNDSIDGNGDDSDKENDEKSDKDDKDDEDDSEEENSAMLTITRALGMLGLRKRSSSSTSTVKIHNFLKENEKDSAADIDEHISLPKDYSIYQIVTDGSIMLTQKALENVDVVRDINKLNTEGFSLLHLAARHNHTAIINILLDHGANVNVCDFDYSATPLHLAARYDIIAAAKCLIERNANINSKNIYGTTPLHFGVRRGNAELCEMLIKAGVSINATDNAENTPLHAAMLCENENVVKMLMDHGASPSACDVEGERPIHVAASEDQCEFIELLAKKAIAEIPEDKKDEELKKFINVRSHEKDTPLHLAAQAGYEETVKTLIKLGADINALTDTKQTPLHLAAISGQCCIVEHLINNGAKIDVFDKQQMTPLHKACQFGRLETVKYLHKNGAKIDAKDDEDFTPLMCAVWKGQKDIVEYLLDADADINVVDISSRSLIHLAVDDDLEETLKLLLVRGCEVFVDSDDNNNRRPLHYAASIGNEEAIEILLKYSAEIDCSDHEGKTPIHDAAKFRKFNCLKILIEATPALVNSTDDRGRSPLHLAAINGHKRICHILIENGAETFCKDDVNWTPLDYAAQYGHSKVAKLLLDNDAPVDAVDKNGKTPLHHASMCGHIDCINLLLDNNASISHQNKDGKNCLDFAVENHERDACMAFIKHKRWKEAISHVDNNGSHPMEKLIAVAPEVAEVILNRCMQPSQHSVTHPNYSITYDFEYIDLNPNDQVNEIYFGPSCMLLHHRESLLSHPVTVALINDKFAQLGLRMFVGNLGVYLVFVGLLTSLVLVDKDRMSKMETQRIKTRTQRTIPWVLLAFTIIQIVKELVQLFFLRWRYFKDIANYLEIILYTATIVFIIPFIIQNLDPSFNINPLELISTSLTESQQKYLQSLENIKWNVGSIVILISWLNLLLHLYAFPFFGIYVVMFIEVFKTVISVLFVFGMFIVAFGLAFFVLLDTQDAFRYPGRSIIKTAVMSIGELEYSDIFSPTIDEPYKVPYTVLTFFVLVLFLFMMPTLLMNLLVGLSIGDIEAVRKNAYHTILKAQIKYLRLFEKSDRKLLNSMISYNKKKVYRPNNKFWWRHQTGGFFSFLIYLFFNWLIKSDHKLLKENQLEVSSREEHILEELSVNRKELDKQKKRIKTSIELLEDDADTIKKIYERLKIEEDD